MQLLEHAGHVKSHDPHVWWSFDARQTSPKTCPICLSLNGSNYRGDEVDNAFPYHIHRTVADIKTLVHPHCRCVLRWAGRTEDVLKVPYGFITRKVRHPTIPKELQGQLSPSQLRLRKQIVKYARETYKRKHYGRR